MSADVSGKGNGARGLHRIGAAEVKRSEPETLVERFGAKWLADRLMDNRFNPVELVPFRRAWVIRQTDRGGKVDVMSWDVLGGQAKRPSKIGTPPRPLA